jgi:hypothetical protein
VENFIGGPISSLREKVRKEIREGVVRAQQNHRRVRVRNKGGYFDLCIYYHMFFKGMLRGFQPSL